MTLQCSNFKCLCIKNLKTRSALRNNWLKAITQLVFITINQKCLNIGIWIFFDNSFIFRLLPGINKTGLQNGEIVESWRGYLSTISVFCVRFCFSPRSSIRKLNTKCFFCIPFCTKFLRKFFFMWYFAQNFRQNLLYCKYLVQKYDTKWTFGIWLYKITIQNERFCDNFGKITIQNVKFYDHFGKICYLWLCKISE